MVAGRLCLGIFILKRGAVRQAILLRNHLYGFDIQHFFYLFAVEDCHCLFRSHKMSEFRGFENLFDLSDKTALVTGGRLQQVQRSLG